MARSSLLLVCFVVTAMSQTACCDSSVKISLTLLSFRNGNIKRCPLMGIDNAGGFSVEMRYRCMDHNSSTVDNWVLLNTLTEGIIGL